MKIDFKSEIQAILEQVEQHRLGKSEALARIKELRGGAARVEAGSKAELVYFREKWVGAPLEGKVVAEQEGKEETRQVLILDSDSEGSSGNGVAEGMEAGVVRVSFGAEFLRRDQRTFCIRAEERSDYERLVRTLAEEDLLPEGIIHMGERGPDELGERQVREQLRRGPEALVLTWQALLGVKRKTLRYLYCHGVGENELIAECISGVCKEIGLEHGGFTGRVCAVEKAGGTDRDVRVTELWGRGESSVEVRHLSVLDGSGIAAGDRHGVRREGREVERVRLAREEAPVLRDGGVCLISGGAGGLGFTFAEYMARRSRARLILMGRSALSEEAEERLARLEKLGGQVRYVRGDVGILGDVEAAVAEARKSFGPVEAVIHAAGVMPYGRVADIGMEALEGVWRAKIFGAIHLDTATRNEPLQWMALFSSIASVIGVAEACGYASGNAFLDAFAEWRRRQAAGGVGRGRTVSFNWPLWEKGGMQVDAGAAAAWREWMWSSQGMRPLSEAAGIRAFEDGIGSEETRIIVAEGDAGRIADTLRRGLGWAGKRDGGVRKAEMEGARTKKRVEARNGSARDMLMAALREGVKELLSVPEEAIDLRAGLVEFGFDSISLKAFAERLNEQFGLDLMPSIFFTHSTLNALADHIAAAHPEAVGDGKLKGDGNGMSAGAAMGGGGAETSEDIRRSEGIEIEGGNNQEESGEEDAIAIVGMSGFLPGSPDLETFWEHLEKGDDLIREIPASRWDSNAGYEAGRAEAGKTNSKWGGFIEGVDEFDARFFGIPPWEAERMDPQHRLFLEAAWNCLESAGESAEGLSGRAVGVFVGIQFHEYQDLLAFESDLHMYNATGNGHAMIANRLSYFLNFRGPSEAIDTACSSSLVALNRAVSAIRGGECEAAIVGGVSLMLSPGTLVVTSQMGILSPDGRCKVFDASANGYVKGEGVLAVYVMPLSKAKKGGYPIWGIVRGIGVNHGGKASSLTAPNAQAQSELVEAVYKRAGVDVESVSYIEAHGTGTELGDPVEVEGLKSAFAVLSGRSEWAKPFCGLGSVKSAIGHLEPAAGLAGVIKVLLAMRHGILPGTLHVRQLNPYLKLEKSPFEIICEKREWTRGRGADGRELPRRAGVSSFGFGGANAHVLLEEYLGRRSIAAAAHGVTDRREEEPVVVVLSAKSEGALRRRAGDLAGWLEKHGAGISLRELAYTLQTGRSHFEWRCAVLAGSAESLKRALWDVAGGVVEQERAARTGMSSLREGWEVWFGKAGDGNVERGGGSGEGAAGWAAAFVRGETLDWNELYEGQRVQRLVLAGYPFEATRHWYPKRRAGGTSTSEEEAASGLKKDEVAVELRAGKVISGVKLKALARRDEPEAESRPERMRSGGLKVGTGDPEAEGERSPAERGEARKGDADRNVRVTGRAEVLAEIKRIVATALYLEAETLEEAKTFVELGSDSILGVEIIRRINTAFKLNIPASKLYEHPNVSALAEFIFKLKPAVNRDLDAGEKGRDEGGKNAGRGGERLETESRKEAAGQARVAERVAAGLGEARDVGNRAEAVKVTRSGDVGDLELGEVGFEELGGNDIEVRVVAATVILPDLLCVRGIYPTMPPYPFTPGFEFSGVVTRIGGRVSLHRVGEAVFGVTGDRLGGQAVRLMVREDLAVKVPEELSMEEAATIPEAFLTATVALYEVARLGEGERILIHSAASGTGLAAIQLAQMKKAEIFATVGSEEKAAYLRKLGVRQVANYRAGEFEEFAKEAIGGGGVDVILNLLTGAPRAEALRVLAPFGRFLDLAVGGLKASGQTDLSSMVSNQAYYSIDCRRIYEREPGRIQRILKRLAAMAASGEIRPLPIHGVFGLDQAQEAYACVRDRVGIGKILLCPEVGRKGRGSVEEKREDLGVNGKRGSEELGEIAVIGMACRFPGAKNLEEFWKLLSEGKCAVREVPAERWAVETYYDPDPQRPGKTYSKWGGFLDGIEEFDPLFFNISPAEAEQMDPQQRLFLETAWHALEDAGCATERISGVKCGVFAGVGQGDYIEAVRRSGSGFSAQLLMGSSCSMVGSRIAYFLNLTGPSVAVDTACSSSLVAIYQACQSLAAGDSELALAGGVCVMTTPAMYIMMSKAGMLSREGLCKTFDQSADGFVPGEGVGLVVLKRMADARRDGDRIYGVIKGVASNQDGATNGITAPNPAAQKALELEVYRRAGIDPQTIGFVEAHGTGTKLGDPIEIGALTEAFREFTDRGQFCAVGSVKTNIGHTLSAAGVASVIKALLCLDRKKLVASLGYERQNEHIEFESSPFYVNTGLKDWAQPEGGGARRAAVSSFGFSGTNVHLVLEEAPKWAEGAGAGKRWHLAVLSARTEEGLRQRVRELWQRLGNLDGEARLEDVCYNLNARRMGFRKRCFVVADTIESLREGLGAARFGESLKMDEAERERGRKEAGRLIGALGEGLSSEEYRQILLELGELYLRGIAVDWERLHAGESQRQISLPGYPFERKRCWAAFGGKGESGAREQSGEVIGTVGGAEEKGCCFSRRVAGADWFLADHVVNGVRTVPGAIWVEMARAVAAAWGNGRRVTSLRSIVFPQGLQLASGDGAVEVEVRAVSGGSGAEGAGEQGENGAGGAKLEFVISSGRGVGTKRHAQGLVWTGEREAGREKVSIEALGSDGKRRYGKEEIYDYFNRVGLEYGPRFRVLSWISAGEEEVWGRLDGMGVTGEAGAGFEMDPAFLDGAMQAMAGWSMSGRLEMPFALPFEIQEVQLMGVIGPSGYVRVRRRGGSGERGIFRFDVQIFDVAGVECCRVKGLAMKAAKAEGIEARVFRPVWRMEESSEEVVDGSVAEGGLLLFDNNDQRAEAIRGKRIGVIQVKSGPFFERLGENVYQVCPGSWEDFRKLASAAGATGFGVRARAVLQLWLLDSNFVSGSREWLRDGFFSDVALARALMEGGADGRREVRVVQAYRHAYGGMASGWAKSVVLEHPDYRCTAVEVGIEDEEELVSRLLEEVRSKKWEAEVRLSVDGRRVRGFEEVGRVGLEKESSEGGLGALRVRRPDSANGEEARRGGVEVREKGVYLITGGLGGLGQLVAEHLRRTKACKLVLVGRSEANEEELGWLKKLNGLDGGEWLGSETGASAEEGEVIYERADVSSLEEVARVVAVATREFGGINGIVHAAGILRDGRLVTKSEGEMEEVLAPKVAGTLNLDAATRGMPLDFVVLFSSVAGALGNAGQCEYAAANAFLGRFAEWRENARRKGEREGETICIYWPWWREGGMRIDEQTREWMRTTWGLEGLESGAGMRLFEAILNAGSSEALVLCGDAQRWGEIGRAKRERSEAKAGAREGAAEGHSGKLRHALIRMIAEQLKVEAEEIGQDEDLTGYGFDSISFTEFSNKLNRVYGIETTPALFFEYPTVAALGDFLVSTWPEQFEEKKRGEEAGAGAAAAAKAAPVVERPVAAVSLKAEVEAVAAMEAGELSGAIAVIGMDGRFPGANNLEEYWGNLKEGRDCIREVPVERWDWKRLPAELEHAKWGGFMEGMDRFDAGLFGISRREAELMDPQQRLFLESVWAALEDAGYPSGGQKPLPVGIFVGVSTSDYAELVGRELATEAHSPTGLSHSILVNRVSYLLNLSGPSEAINTACSSSLVAVHRAVRSLREGECEMAIAAGVSAILTPTTTLGFLKAGMLSKGGRCRTFDEGADGYVRGEGVGAVLLKRWPEALRDGDRVYGLILGSAVNHGGRTNTLTAPNPAAEAAVVLAACRDAKIEARTLSYIEAHGTATALGDPIEVNGLKKAFGAGNGGTREKSCGLGSVKSNIGHLEAAAGIAGVLKVLLALREKTLPASLHVTKVNPYIRLEGSPFYIVTETRAWERQREEGGMETPRRCGVSSFGFGGANAHVVIQEAPERRYEAGGGSGKTWYLAALSARDQKALEAKYRELAEWLRRDRVGYRLEDICFTLNAGRHHLARRCAFLVRSREELLASLDGMLDRGEAENAMSGDRSRIKPEDEALYEAVWELSIAGLRQFRGDGEAYREKLWSLAGLYIKGHSLDWAVIHEGESRRRIPLPIYPFQRERYWLPERSGAGAENESEREANGMDKTNGTNGHGQRGMGERAEGGLVGLLVGEAAELLKVREAEISADRNLSDFGFDSFNFKMFAERLNARFGTELLPNVFFIYPTLAELAEYLSATAKAGESEAVDRALEGNGAAKDSGVGKKTVKERAGESVVEPIAIIGMSGAFPGAADLREFWANLVEGKDAIREVPAGRWDWRLSYGSGLGKSVSKWGGFMEGVENFDAEFFGISPREAEVMDPQHRLFLEHAWRAVEGAGQAPEKLSGQAVGVFAGIEFSDYRELLAARGISDPYGGTGNAHSIAANRISYLLNLRGPSESIDTACSSSLVALNRAVQSLRLGECDSAVAGGVSLMLTPSAFVASSELGALSSDGRCKAFDAAANGYVRGEGVGVVYLMRLSEAERGGYPILGVIKGIAVSHGGRAQSLTAPNARAQADLLVRAYGQAGVSVESIGYIEAHGTGTELGDPVEIEGLKSGFSALAEREGVKRVKAGYCGIGSVKSNIGHLEPAAGIAGVIKVLLAMRHGVIPPTLHVKKVNPFIRLEGSPFFIAERAVDWKRMMISEGGEMMPRRAGVSSFGFGGTNAHVVLEEYSGRSVVEETGGRTGSGGGDSACVVTISAKTAEGLRQRAMDLADWISREGAAHLLAEVAYTLNVGRGQYGWRIGIVAGTLEELEDGLNRRLEQEHCGAMAPVRGRSGDSRRDGELKQRVGEVLGGIRREGMRRELLMELGGLYEAGAEVEWEQLYDKGERMRRIELPTYPFSRKRFWVTGGNGTDGGNGTHGTDGTHGTNGTHGTKTNGTHGTDGTHGDGGAVMDDSACLRLLTEMEEEKLSVEEVLKRLRP